MPATAAVVTLSGDVDLSAAAEMADALSEVWLPGTQDLVIDLRGCTFLDCSCLGLLWRTCDEAPLGGQCVITGAGGTVRRVLSLTGFLDTVAEVDGESGPGPATGRVLTRHAARWW